MPPKDLPRPRSRKRSTTTSPTLCPSSRTSTRVSASAEATYLLAKQFIEAGACCIQIENQVSDEKQCGHQDGKVTVPHEDFLAKIRAIRYASPGTGRGLDGIIVARTDSLGAGLTKHDRRDQHGG
ncbi:hypothetical protein ACU4GD_19140 [Cupriavidus basilensis]